MSTKRLMTMILKKYGPKPLRKYHSAEVKARVMADCARGVPQGVAGRRHGVSPKTVQTWVRRARLAAMAEQQSASSGGDAPQGTT